MHAALSPGGASGLGGGLFDRSRPAGSKDVAGPLVAAPLLAAAPPVAAGEHAARSRATIAPSARGLGAGFAHLVSMRLISMRLYRHMERAQPGTTELVILGLVAFGERSGYDLAQQVDRSIGYLWGPSRSQIYKVLPRLVARGLARAREVPQRDRPDKALYRITPAGHRALRSWLEEVDVEPAGGPNVFVLKLFFCDLVPARAAHAQLAGYRSYLTRRVDRFESMLRELDEVDRVFPQLVLRRAIARIHTSLSWAEEVAGVVGGAGGVRSATTASRGATSRPKGDQRPPTPGAGRD